MQSYPLNLKAGASSQVINSSADLFVYESGQIVPVPNMLLSARDVSSPVWLRWRAISVVANARVDQYGALAAAQLSASGDLGGIYQFVPCGFSENWTFSVDLMADVQTVMQLQIHCRNAAAQSTVVTQNVTVGPNWQRYSMGRVTDTDAVLVGCLVQLQPGQSVYMGNPKLEPGAFATPFTARESVGVSPLGDARIRVRPESGAEIVLRPGQSFRNPGGVKTWYVSLFDGVTSVAANVILGSGEFTDSNTSNTVKIDASFANMVTVANDNGHPIPVLSVDRGVTVQNSVAQRVPVTLDQTQTLPVSIAGLVQISGNAVLYQSSVAGNSPVQNAVQLVAPSANVNGMRVSRSILAPGISQDLYLLAKSAAPSSQYDGDLLTWVKSVSGPVRDSEQVTIPAGRGLYLWAVCAGPVACERTVLYTLL